MEETKLGITVNFEWQKRETDLSSCYNCLDQVFSNIYVLVINSSSGKLDLKFSQDSDLYICESCFNLMEKKLKKKLNK